MAGLAGNGANRPLSLLSPKHRNTASSSGYQLPFRLQTTALNPFIYLWIKSGSGTRKDAPHFVFDLVLSPIRVLATYEGGFMPSRRPIKALRGLPPLFRCHAPQHFDLFRTGLFVHQHQPNMRRHLNQHKLPPVLFQLVRVSAFQHFRIHRPTDLQPLSAFLLSAFYSLLCPDSFSDQNSSHQAGAGACPANLRSDPGPGP